MARKGLIVFFLVTIIILLVTFFSDGMVSNFSLQKYYSSLYRQSLSDGELFEGQNSSEEVNRNASPVAEQSIAQGSILSEAESNATVLPVSSKSLENKDKNAHDFEKSPEGNTTIFGRIDPTDAEWKRKVDVCYTYDKEKSPIPEIQQCIKRLPEAILIGVKKCGTGTLSRYLDLHPAVSMSTEVKFPETSVTTESIARWIQRMPLSSPYQLPMTEDPSFCFLPLDFFRNLKPHLSPQVKFLFILRNPVQRAVSDYLHHVAHSNAPEKGPFDVVFKNIRLRETFEKTVLKPDGTIVPSNIIRYGVYVTAVQTVLDIYTRDKIHFIDGDAFADDPYPSLHELEAFLGLPEFYRQSHFIKNHTKGFYCAQVPERPDFGCMIPSKGRPHPKISDDVLKRLYDYYRPYNRALADQLGLNFSWIHK